VYGTYESYEGKPAVRFERVYPHPVARVWRSITVPEELASWFPSTVEVDLREGGAMRFTFDPHLAEPMEGRVVELDPPKVFAFLWGKDLLRLELAPEGEGTRLTLTQTLEADEAARNAAGWHVCLDRLERLLAGAGAEAPGAEPTREWSERYEAYQRRGVPAGAPVPGQR
jgi:uncharacterized protein YndB with AHSA1/START domain